MKPKILIVEDNHADVELMRYRLEELGLECCIEVKNDGQAAIDYALKTENGKYINKPDLIILDLNLPFKNGKEVLRELKKHPAYKLTPIIIFSTSESQSDIEDVYEYANSYVVKPFELDKFNAAIDSIYHFWLNSARLPGKKAF